MCACAYVCVCVLRQEPGFCSAYGEVEVGTANGEVKYNVMPAAWDNMVQKLTSIISI